MSEKTSSTGAPAAVPARWIPTRGSSMHVSRSIRGCRRSGCLTRFARRATPVATVGCGTTSARCVHGSRPSRWCGSRRRRGVSMLSSR